MLQVERQTILALNQTRNQLSSLKSDDKETIIHAGEGPYNKFSYIKDAVDTLIEKVLENGGDVEFVEPGMLKDYNHLALIQYY